MFIMGILNNPNRMIPIRAYSLEKPSFSHLLGKMMVFQDALILFLLNTDLY